MTEALQEGRYFLLVTNWPKVAPPPPPSAGCQNRCPPWCLIGQINMNEVGVAPVRHLDTQAFVQCVYVCVYLCYVCCLVIQRFSAVGLLLTDPETEEHRLTPGPDPHPAGQTDT